MRSIAVLGLALLGLLGCSSKPSDSRAWWKRGSAACPDGAPVSRSRMAGGWEYRCKGGPGPYGAENDQGVVLEIGQYGEDGEHGLWQQFDPAGRLVSEVIYDHRRRIALRRWRTDGTIESAAYSSSTGPAGWVEFDEDGWPTRACTEHAEMKSAADGAICIDLRTAKVEDRQRACSSLMCP